MNKHDFDPNPCESPKKTTRPTLNYFGYLLLILIRVYQVTLSHWIGGQCRFYPTCSVYAVQAIKQKGSLRGIILTTKRLARCHPFHPGGVDLICDDHQCQPKTENG